MAKLYDDFIFMLKMLENSEYDSLRMDRILESKDFFKETDVYISGSKLSSIKRFYESTNDFNRDKISNLINNSIRNIDKVYNLVVEYEKIKQQRRL